MSASFQQILRTRTAEQLTNMHRNKDNWTAEEQALISEEVKNRGLEVFDEPEEWTDEVMESVDTVNPQTEFEKDMAFLTAEKTKYQDKKGIALAAQIVSISAVISGFSFFYLYIQNVIFLGVTTTMQLTLLATFLGITGVILFVLKKYIPSIIVSGLSLIITLMSLLTNLADLL